MLSKFSNKQRNLVIVIAGVFIIGWIFLCVNVGKFALSQFTPDPTHEPPIEITYCGVVPEGICILSFGSDGSGDTVIHLFVSPPTFPDFYLIVNKTLGQVTYECEKDENEETSIYCSGEAILLGEQVEITILSVEGDIPIATGKFAVTGILVFSTNDTHDSSSSTLRDVTPVATSQSSPTVPNQTQTATTPTTPTATTPTPTPAVSYPNYP